VTLNTTQAEKFNPLYNRDFRFLLWSERAGQGFTGALALAIFGSSDILLDWTGGRQPVPLLYMLGFLTVCDEIAGWENGLMKYNAMEWTGCMDGCLTNEIYTTSPILL